MKCVGGHDGVQHRRLDCGDGERWEAVGMGADGSKGGGMEGALCLCRVVAAAAGPHRTGHWGSPPHLLRCPSLRCGVQATAGQGSGMFPSGWEIQTQPWPPRLTAVSRGASGADGQAQCPMAHPHSCSSAQGREETCVPTDEVSGGQQLDSASRSLPALSYHLKR